MSWNSISAVPKVLTILKKIISHILGWGIMSILILLSVVFFTVVTMGGEEIIMFILIVVGCIVAIAFLIFWNITPLKRVYFILLVPVVCTTSVFAFYQYRNQDTVNIVQEPLPAQNDSRIVAFTPTRRGVPAREIRYDDIDF